MSLFNIECNGFLLRDNDTKAVAEYTREQAEAVVRRLAVRCPEQGPFVIVEVK